MIRRGQFTKTHYKVSLQYYELIISEKKVDGAKKIRLVKGDITQREVDVIVNAANSQLVHGGGVAAAIVRRGGQIIQKESEKIGFVPVVFFCWLDVGAWH